MLFDRSAKALRLLLTNSLRVHLAFISLRFQSYSHGLDFCLCLSLFFNNIAAFHFWVLKSVLSTKVSTNCPVNFGWKRWTHEFCLLIFISGRVHQILCALQIISELSAYSSYTLPRDVRWNIPNCGLSLWLGLPYSIMVVPGMNILRAMRKS